MAIKKIPCGGFYVNDDAVEMIDGKPVLQTGDSDPAIKNAKETGGFGWTESGGNIEIIGETTVTSPDYTSEILIPMTGMNLKQVYENVDSSNIRVVYDGAFSESCNVDYDDDSGYFTLYSDINGEYKRVAYQDENHLDEIFIITSNPNTTVTVEAYVISDGTVHTIDPKYISGGAMVVHFEVDTASGAPTLIADKTVAEVKTAMLTMPVSGVLTAGGTALAMSLMSNYDDMSLCFTVLSSAGEGDAYKSAVLVEEESGEWALHG